MKGKLIIISAPSGTGKSTIINELIKDDSLKLEFSISATTREPRKGEIDGVNYYFMSVDEFKESIKNDDFAEYQEVYPGRFYGTLKKEIQRIMDDGRNVILDIDVLGGMNVKRIYGSDSMSIFILPPSIDVLKQRLISRGTDSIEEINKRVQKSSFELSFAPKFDKTVVNDDLSTAVEKTRSIIKAYID
jgi:guanylate kinase